MRFIGEIAALGTAFLWATSAVCFTSAGKRIGSYATNRYRTIIGCIFLYFAHLFVLQKLLPSFNAVQFALLASSGIVGIVIGDTFLFQSYVDIGPRTALPIFNTHPFFTAVLAILVLGERLPAMGWLGMFITLSGAAWVIYEENRSKNKASKRHMVRGIIFAVLAAIGQSTGYVIAKPTITGDGALDPLSATLIRLMAAAIGFLLIGAVKKDWGRLASDIKDRRAMLLLGMGSVMGPFLGIWLSLVALKFIPAGIAATLIATLPVVILPVVIFVYKEKVSWRAALGAAITVIGVAVLLNAKR